MKNLYIFRHGQTDWNKEERLQGHTDIPLNQFGKEQAATLQEKLLNLKLDICLSSDLSRAVETARIALKNHQIDIHTPKELREIALGIAEGKLKSELENSSDWEKWLSPDYPDFSFEGGEVKSHHQKVMRDYLDDFLKNSNYSEIAISSHGGSIRLLLRTCKNPPQSFITKNCSLHHVQIIGNDWNYLGEI